MSGTWTNNGVSETVNVLLGTTPPSDPVPDTGSTAALLGAGVVALAFAKRIEGAGKILTMLNKELTEEEIDRSIQILTEINKEHPEMLGG